MIPGRRVVITGIGMVSPLGVGAGRQVIWPAICQGKSGIRALPSDICADLPAQIAACVPGPTEPHGFNPDDWVSRANKRTQGVPFIAYAVAAAQLALADAHLEGWAALYDQARAGVAVGSGIGAIDEIAAAGELLGEHGKGPGKLSPFFVPRVLVNMAAGAISQNHALRGPQIAPATACATGACAVGDAFRAIKYGEADLMLAGGTESTINRVAIAGFARAKALSTKWNAEPEKASRPFDAGRDGFVLGEGSAILILEEAEAAQRRGAHVYAEITGYGRAGDAHHVTAPSADGAGAQLAMRSALLEAGHDMGDISYVNAHATSTPLGDAIEARAVAQLRAEAQAAPDAPLPISSTKFAVGHMLGAAGAFEAVMAALAVNTDTIPGTATLDAVDSDIQATHDGKLDFVQKTLQQPVLKAMSNSFGFGGINTSLVFSKP